MHYHATTPFVTSNKISDVVTKNSFIKGQQQPPSPTQNLNEDNDEYVSFK